MEINGVTVPLSFVDRQLWESKIRWFPSHNAAFRKFIPKMQMAIVPMVSGAIASHQYMRSIPHINTFMTGIGEGHSDLALITLEMWHTLDLTLYIATNQEELEGRSHIVTLTKVLKKLLTACTLRESNIVEGLREAQQGSLDVVYMFLRAVKCIHWAALLRDSNTYIVFRYGHPADSIQCVNHVDILTAGVEPHLATIMLIQTMFEALGLHGHLEFEAIKTRGAWCVEMNSYVYREDADRRGLPTESLDVLRVHYTLH